MDPEDLGIQVDQEIQKDREVQPVRLHQPNLDLPQSQVHPLDQGRQTDLWHQLVLDRQLYREIHSDLGNLELQ